MAGNSARTKGKQTCTPGWVAAFMEAKAEANENDVTVRVKRHAPWKVCPDRECDKDLE